MRPRSNPDIAPGLACCTNALGTRLTSAACGAAAGFADGSHRLAAAATIPGDDAEAFIQMLARAAGTG